MFWSFPKPQSAACSLSHNLAAIAGVGGDSRVVIAADRISTRGVCSLTRANDAMTKRFAKKSVESTVS